MRPANALDYTNPAVPDPFLPLLMHLMQPDRPTKAESARRRRKVTDDTTSR